MEVNPKSSSPNIHKSDPDKNFPSFSHNSRLKNLHFPRKFNSVGNSIIHQQKYFIQFFLRFLLEGYEPICLLFHNIEN
jgi:hypothetical protein